VRKKERGDQLSMHGGERGGDRGGGMRHEGSTSQVEKPPQWTKKSRGSKGEGSYKKIRVGKR